jgi:hypothetical protein
MKQPEVNPEHRWARSVCCEARVRLSTRSGITGSGRIRDISACGAFIQTTVVVPLEVELSVAILGNHSAPHLVDLSAVVVRLTDEGMGVEWRNAPSCPICSFVGCTARCPGAETLT